MRGDSFHVNVYPVSEPRPVQIVLELEPDAEPISGWARVEGSGRREFIGLLGLVAILDDLRRVERGGDGAHGQDPGARS
jgi:hypothetical protein